jgi:hypothetical protein
MRPVIYWAILGIALGAGGMSYTFFAILGINLLLACVLPPSDFELMLVASVCCARAVVQCLQLLLLHPNLFSVERILEPVFVAVLASILLTTQKRVLAWCLIVYAAIMAGLLLQLVILHFPKVARPQLQLATAAINGLLVWLLVCWLQKMRPVISVLHDFKTHSPGANGHCPSVRDSGKQG